MAPSTSPLKTVRLSDGRRELIENLTSADGSVIHKGFITDFSSIPYASVVVVLVVLCWVLEHFFGVFVDSAVFLLLLLLPHYSRVDIAGVKHDHRYKSGHVSKWKADWEWMTDAMAGEHSASRSQAIVGFVGLTIGGWPAWWKHRRNDKDL